MGSVEEFNRELTQWATVHVPQRIRDVTVKLCLEALSRLVMKTPVDTGRARGGWQVAIAGKGELVSVLQGMAAERAALDPDGSVTISRGAAIINAMPDFAIIDIENNVHYILQLEDGHSGQAPSGMLSVTVEELVAMFK
jgi:hypothetical protein